MQQRSGLFKNEISSRLFFQVAYHLHQTHRTSFNVTAIRFTVLTRLIKQVVLLHIIVFLKM